jgi:hypothetical protein
MLRLMIKPNRRKIAVSYIREILNEEADKISLLHRGT